MKLFIVVSICILARSSVAQMEVAQKEETPGFICETGIRLNNAYALYSNLSFDECTYQCLHEDRCMYVSMQSHNCLKFDKTVKYGVDNIFTTCTKLQHPTGYWRAECSGPSDNLCVRKLDMQTTNNFNPSHEDQWEKTVTATLQMNYFFNGQLKHASNPAGKSIFDAFQKSKQSKQHCGKIVRNPKCNQKGNITIWQFVATAEINLLAYNDPSGQTLVSTCDSYITHSFHIPRCVPGTCADCECLKCA